MTDIGRLNTDREIWRERAGDFYAARVFVTQDGSIGIDNGGHVVVRPVREWFRAVSEIETLRARLAAAERVVTVARTMDAELDDVNNTVLLIVSDQKPYFARAYKRAIATASRLRDSIAAYDQGKVTICDSAPTEGE